MVEGMGKVVAGVAWLAFLMVLALPMVATAEEFSWPSHFEVAPVEPAQEGDVAVIVAVEDYAFLPDVPGAATNGQDWEAYFRQSLGMESVYLISDQNAAREEMLRFARQAVEEVEEGGRVWYVFIGHGTPMMNGEDGGLVGMDGRQTVESLEARSVGQQELLAILEAGPQGETILVIDACFSGRTGDGEALAEGMQPVMPLTAAPEVGGRSVILSAARADQFAGPLPGMERPAFSYLLLGALRGWAADASGRVEAQEAVRYVERQLRGVPGRQQTPELFGNSDVVLARGAQEPDPVRQWQEAQALASQQALEATAMAQRDDEMVGSNRLAGTVLLSGAALTLGGLGLGLSTLPTRNALAAGEYSQSEAEAPIASINQRMTGAYVLGGLGVVALGTGLLMWERSEKGQSVGALIGDDGLVGVQIGGRW